VTDRRVRSLFQERSLLARPTRSAYGGFLAFSAHTGLIEKGSKGSTAVDHGYRQLGGF